VSTTATAASFVVALAARGKPHFTTEEAATALGGSIPAVRAALRRLKAKGEIADPFRGFHVIVAPEYRKLGCLPADQFVPQLMQHLGEPYYVALLSAAELHGAAHQRPQAFQVMVRTNRRAIECGQVRVQFIARKNMKSTSAVEKKNPRGHTRVSSPEATALELVGYADQSGGLDNVASVLAELVDAIDSERLVSECRRSPIAWVQRLGYLLDLTEQRDLADKLTPSVAERAKEVAPLVRAQRRSGAPRDASWKLAVNATVEPSRDGNRRRPA
jgi:predicted transcriptional regulator of viral defense system